MFSSSFIYAQKNIKLDNFSSLNVSGGIKVELIHGSTHGAEVDIIKGDFDDLKIKVEGDELDISWKSKGWGWGGNNGNRKANIKLTYTELDGIDVSAGASVFGEESISGENMEIDASSGASVKVAINVKDTEVDVSSGATSSISGKTNHLEVDVSSGASFKGSELEAQDVEVSVSSGASAKVWANKSLEAEASSGGSVKYKGDPSELDLDPGKYSGGSIKKM